MFDEAINMFFDTEHSFIVDHWGNGVHKNNFPSVVTEKGIALIRCSRMPFRVF